jgi:hypothetical protein
MNWESWFCSNQACNGGAWMVQRDPATSDVWRVAAQVAHRPFTVAATDPICPRCGAPLLGMVELEGGTREQIGAAIDLPAL